MQYDRQEQQTIRNPASQGEAHEFEMQNPEEQAEIVEAQTQDEQSDAAEAEEYLDLLRRTQADFINYRRRVGQEQAALRVTAQSELLSHLFPVLDDLARAMAAAPQDLLRDPWVEGVLLISRRLMTQLEQLGVRNIGSPGEQFDPHRHEAVMTERRIDVADGTVLQVLRPGYAFDERVIRPAQVVVARDISANDE